MKKTLIFLLFISFTSCVENEINFPSSSTSQPTNGSFTVNIDGQTFTTEESEFSIINNNLFITAIKANTNEVFNIKVENFSLSTFSFEGNTTNIASYLINNSSDIWSTVNQQSPSGEISFSEIDLVNNVISGNFNFIGKHSNGSAKTFTNGIFNKIPLRVNPVTNDSFFVKVNGVEYVEEEINSSEISVGGNGLIIINANKSSTGEILSITLPVDITPGEHDFGFVTNPPLGQYTIGGSTYLADGKINITEHNLTNKTITASFEFDASPLISTTPNFSFTEGEFSITY